LVKHQKNNNKYTKNKVKKILVSNLTKMEQAKEREREREKKEREQSSLINKPTEEKKDISRRKLS
jgi:hypothetical protein